jgi:hypothetical protein
MTSPFDELPYLPFPSQTPPFGERSPVTGNAVIQGKCPIDNSDMTFEWRHHADGSISDVRITRGTCRYPEPPRLPRWKRFLARLLLGDGWVHFRFVRPRRHL